MTWKATQVQLSYEYTRLLPEDDSVFIDYNNFKAIFGEDGTQIILGIQDKDFYAQNHFNAWYDLAEEIREIDGVSALLSISKAYNLVKDTVERKFQFVPLFKQKPESQKELDSIQEIVLNLPIYKNVIHND